MLDTLRHTRQALLDQAMEQEIIDGCLEADGWVFLYVGGHEIRLTEGQLLTFLQGAVGFRSLPAAPRQRSCQPAYA